jgi:hypothetical protein
MTTAVVCGSSRNGRPSPFGAPCQVGSGAQELEPAHGITPHFEDLLIVALQVLHRHLIHMPPLLCDG